MGKRKADVRDATLECLAGARLSTERIGRVIRWMRQAESTNDAAWAEAARGCPDGTVILAEEQSAGRGRQGRTWHSPRGRGILCSVVLRPGLGPEEASLLTVIGALAVRDAGEALTGAKALIRWPNDVMIGGRKAAGVLVEARTVDPGDSPTYVAGIGVNVGMEERDFPPELRHEATSLSLAAGKPVDRVEAARRLIEALDAWYLRLRSGRSEEIAAAWRESSAVLRQRVEVTVDGGVHRGTVEDLDPREGIFLRLDTGGILRLRGEHVELLRLSP